MEGFDLLSKESVALQNKQSSTSMEGDAWIISLHEAENLLLVGGARKKVLSILKTIRDRHLDLQVIIKMTKTRMMILMITGERNFHPFFNLRATLCQCLSCKPWCSMSARNIPGRKTGRRWDTHHW